ncbi:YigZ family protein, partial [Flavihumibacter sediminis]|nr:YigZ family protein [Flavihumibacter sediminis]
QFDYTMINEIMMIIKQCNCTLLKQEVQLFCLYKIGVPLNREEEVLYRLKQLHTVEVKAC